MYSQYTVFARLFVHFLAFCKITVSEHAVCFSFTDAFYEEPCITRCAGANMVCDDLTKTCRCLPGMLPNSNGKHCTPENRPLLGEICDMGKDNCYLQDEQACVNGRCACRNGSRRATCDEILAFNDTVSQCRSEDYSLGKFNYE